MDVSGIDQAAIYELAEFRDRQFLASAAGLGVQVLGEIERMGPLGQYVVECGELALKAIEAIAKVDPNDPGKIIELQGRIRDYQHVVDWVQVKLHEGREAETLLTQNPGEMPDDVDPDDFEDTE